MKTRVLLAMALVVGCSASTAKDGAAVRPIGPSGEGSDAGEPTGFTADDGGVAGFGDVLLPPLDPADKDGDGYSNSDDCDDTNRLVNPGAFEVSGDKVDNDCNGKVDDVDDCDLGLALASSNAMDFARSLGLCKAAKGGATGKDKTWGVISATLQTTDGVGTPTPRQYGIESAWGSLIKPRSGASLVALSTGSARTTGQPDFYPPMSRGPTKNENGVPTGWPRNTTGCAAPKTAKANDSIVLKLVVRVPTNADSFTYDFDFYTSEYIMFVCTEYNDTYVALLKTKATMDPKNAGNISFDKKGDSVNVNSGWFEVCAPGTADSGKKFTCPLGRGELAGTGYESYSPEDGGATSWLRTKASVVPGEEIEIAFMLWNTSDHALQSAVLLDNWQWGAGGTTGTVTPPVTERPR